MGGCASRPKDLDTSEPAPVQAPAVDKSDSIAQENNGGEEAKTEEPLVRAAGDTKPAEEVAEVAEPKPDEKVEAKTEDVVEAVVEAKVEVQQAAEVAPIEAVAVTEPEKIPELIKEEAKPVEAQNSENRSDATLVSV